jgi:adsorption protein B
MFPQTLKAAIRQKTRWVYGITMQSASVRDLFTKSNLSFRERTFLYKDLKAKFANFILLPGYLVFIYFLVGLFVPSLPVMYPYLSPGWWLCVFLSLMMVERQFLRGKAIVNVYGKRMMFFSCLLPPLFPIRLIWGNVINICATTKAWIKRASFERSERQAARSAQDSAEVETLPASAAAAAVSANKNPSQVWVKTDHEFLPEKVLSRYRRRYGDYLLLEGALDEKSLESLVKEGERVKKPLGIRLLEEGVVTEHDLACATALQNGTVAVDLTPSLRHCVAQWGALAFWERAGAWPLVRTSADYLAVMPDTGGPQTSQAFERETGEPSFMLVAPSSALNGIVSELSQAHEKESSGKEGSGVDFGLGTEQLASLCDEGLISLSQAGIALGYALNQDKDVASVVHAMGLLGGANMM